MEGTDASTASRSVTTRSSFGEDLHLTAFVLDNGLDQQLALLVDRLLSNVTGRKVVARARLPCRRRRLVDFTMRLRPINASTPLMTPLAMPTPSSPGPDTTRIVLLIPSS